MYLFYSVSLMHYPNVIVCSRVILTRDAAAPDWRAVPKAGRAACVLRS